MKVSQHKVVTVAYLLKDTAGETLDSSEQSGPLVYIHGTGGLLVGLEAALEGRHRGESFSVTLPPEKAYGIHDPKLLRLAPRGEFDADNLPRVGQQFRVDEQQGPRVVTVVRVEEGTVTLDFNHPLAGVTLRFDVEITGVREATEEELRSGRPAQDDHGSVNDRTDCRGTE